MAERRGGSTRGADEPDERRTGGGAGARGEQRGEFRSSDQVRTALIEGGTFRG